MRWWAIGLMAAALAAAVAVAQGGAVRVAQPNAAPFPEIGLHVYPAGPSGDILTGLGPGSFRVEEDGRGAEVLSVRAEGAPLEVCLALDRSPSMEDERKLEFARAAAVTFVGQLRPGDRAALVTFSSGSSLAQGLTEDRRALTEAIRRTESGGDSTTFLDAVYWSITQVAVHSAAPGSLVGSGPARPEARRVVVALTDGRDHSSRVLTEELIDLARANGVSLYMIAVGSDAELSRMQYLAHQTGGLLLVAPEPAALAELYARIAAELRRAYQVTFRTPRPAADGTRRAVRVSLPEQGLQAETAYLAPATGSVLGGARAAPAAGPGVGAAAPAKRPGPEVLVLGLLALAGAGAVVLVLVLARRTRRPPLFDSNPRLDLLPLWVREGSTRVGRGTECDLVLDSREVSRVHARIEAWDGVYRIVDESRNGTYVNGRRVRRRTEIRVGDVVRFGDREFRFAGRQRP